MTDQALCPDDSDLKLTAARNGDAAALWELSRDWRPYLKAVAAEVLDDQLMGKVDPSDVVQSALLAAVQGFSAFQGNSVHDWRAWLVAIVRNEARQRQRFWRRERRDVDSERPLEQEAHVEPKLATDGATPSQIALRRERAARLAFAISQLRPDDREIIELRHFAGLAHEEIAQRMGRSPAAVRQLWAAAVARLRKQLDNQS